MNNKLKLVFLLDVFDNGGVSTILLNIFNMINIQYFDLDLILFSKNSFENTIPNYVNIYHVFKDLPEKNKNRFIRYIYHILLFITPKRIIRKFIFKKHYDICIDFKSNNLAYLNSFLGLKICWLHKDFSLKTNLYEKRINKEYSSSFIHKFKNYLFLKYLVKVDNIVLISNTTAKSFINRFGFNNKVAVLYNPIDYNKIIKLSKEPVFDFYKTKFTICCVSRISKGKGIERLFKIASKLNDLGFIFDLIIIGNGDYYKDIYDMYKSYKFENVYLLGHKSNPYKYINLSDLFICPSETEAYSNVIVDANVLNIPIITTNTGATKEILKYSKNSIITRNTEYDLYVKIKKYLSSISMIKKPNFINNSKALNKFKDNNSIAKIEQFLITSFTNYVKKNI